jgi:hypothetical protein
VINALFWLVVAAVSVFAMIIGLYMAFLGPLMIVMNEDVGWREAYRRIWFDK